MDTQLTALEDGYPVSRTRWVNADTGEIVDLPQRCDSVASPQLGRVLASRRNGQRDYMPYNPPVVRREPKPKRCRCSACRWFRRLRNELGWVIGLATLGAVAIVSAGVQLGVRP